MRNQHSIDEALAATSDLRLLLLQEEQPSDAQLSRGFASLFRRCESVLEGPACLIPLAFLRERMRAALASRGPGSPSRTPMERSEFRRLALNDLQRLQRALLRLVETSKPMA